MAAAAPPQEEDYAAPAATGPSRAFLRKRPVPGDRFFSPALFKDSRIALFTYACSDMLPAIVLDNRSNLLACLASPPSDSSSDEEPSVTPGRATA